MGTKVLPQHMKKKKDSPKVAAKKRAKYKPKHKVNGAFKKSKLNKYNQQGRYEDDRWFASGAEADRYLQLKEMVEAGRIAELVCQPSYAVHIKGQLICNYRGDFHYIVTDYGKRVPVLEDVKGYPTKDYILKRKMVEALHQVRIFEIPGRRVKAGKTAGMVGYEIDTAKR